MGLYQGLDQWLESQIFLSICQLQKEQLITANAFIITVMTAVTIQILFSRHNYTTTV